MIVDDEPLIRSLIEQILEDLDVEIFSADNGFDAIDMVSKIRPEIVFLDVMMPKMNGFEVCNIIKNELGIRESNIIMLSAKSQETDKQKAVEAGADSYITKPFKVDEIICLVVNLLGLKKS